MTKTTEVPEKALPIWLQVSEHDAQTVEIEKPISDSKFASSSAIGRLYDKAIADGVDDPSKRVYSMLAQICQMHPKPDEPNDPYGPMIVFADGRRSAVPSDFREHLPILAKWAEDAKHPVLQARLSDIVWFLDRKRYQLSKIAAAAYSSIIRQTIEGNLVYEFSDEATPLTSEASEILRRALRLAKVIGWDSPEGEGVKSLVPILWQRAISLDHSVAAIWFCDIDLDYGISAPADLASAIEDYVTKLDDAKGTRPLVDLWRLTARAYHKAKNDERKHLAQTQAAEALATEALTKQGSAMLAAHFLGLAISELHGIPDQKARRTELRHKLIDIQSRIGEEMSSFSHEIDISDLVKQVQSGFEPLGFIELLFAYAALERSPDLNSLGKDAIEQIKRHPLASLFPAAHLDAEGKVLSRSSGGIGHEPDSSQVIHEIAKNENMRRNIAVNGKLEVARRSITSRYVIGRETLRPLIDHSPFIPPSLAATYCQGFARHFQGDFIGATYILVPLLEASIKYILKSHGHDVSIFDNATQTQQDRTISSIFEQMGDELDEIFTPAIRAEIERIFLLKPGPHIRHAVAHGLLSDSSAYDPDTIFASWFIFRLSMMPLFAHQEQINADLSHYFE